MQNNKVHEHIKNSRGFTIIEMIVACAICMVLMLAASTHFVSVAKSLQNADKFASQAIQQQGGSYFKEIFVQASPTYHFLKLPIAANCASPRLPCLRRYDSDSRRFVPNESTPVDAELNSFISARIDASKGIQFYRDGTGTLQTKRSNNIAIPASAVRNAAPANAPVVQIPTPINTAATTTDLRSNAIYATWPLRDEKSQPFPIITQKSNYVLFTHVATLAASTAPLHHMAFFVSKANPDLFPALENTLVAIYTLNDPSEYSVQFIKRIVPCTADGPNSSQCLAWAKSINGGIDAPYVSKKTGATTTAYAELVKAGLTAIDVYDPFQAPGTNIAAQLTKALPDLNVFNSSIPSVRWQNGIAPNFYAFPSDLWSLFDGASVDANKDLAPPFDIRRVQHYYTNLQSQVQIALLPIEVATFWLEIKASDKTQMNLVSQFVRDSSSTLANPKRVMIDDVIPNPNNLGPSKPVPQMLYFSRKLGTPTIDVTIEQIGVNR